MKRRQTRVPSRWLVADERTGDELWPAVRRLPPGSGILVLHSGMAKRERARLLARLRRLGAGRRLVVADELAGDSARVHDAREIRDARLKQAPLLLLSPMFETGSHPEWKPHPRMRAAALLRLAGAPVLALGGMNEQSFAAVRRLGFAGWAGIDAWRLRSLKSRGQAPKSRPKQGKPKT